MATTPGGLPYPVGTDKVVDGDDAIKALALALDPRIIKAGPWLAFTPTWASNGTQPTLGTGAVLRGRFFQHGPTAGFQMEMILGTGFTAGTGGAYSWALPAGLVPAAALIQGVSGRLTNAGKVLGLTGQLQPGSAIVVGVSDSLGATLVPGYAMAAGTQLQLWGTYETSAAFVPSAALSDALVVADD